MNITRHLITLLPAGTEAEAADGLVDAAAALAAAHGAALDIVELQGPAPAANRRRPLAAPARWWQVSHAQLERVDVASMLALALPALRALAPAAPTLVLLPAGSGDELAARLAARLGGAALGRVTGLALDGTRVCAQRAAWGGRVALTLASDAACCVAAWRPARLAAAAGGHAPQLHAPQLHMLVVDDPLPAVPHSEAVASSDTRPALEGARLVVSGGRGMQGEEGFAQLARIADRLGAALGGSLPAVDAGWVPVARQIGQSGKFVGPRRYLAVGISGTPQHLAGVSRDTRIVAVNKDPQAPIFGLAEVGVVAEWQQLLPALEQALAALATAETGSESFT